MSATPVTTTRAELLLQKLLDRFAEKILHHEICHDLPCIEVAYSDIIDVCEHLHDLPEFHFEQLMDLCGVDYANWGQGDWKTQSTTATGYSRARSAAIAGAHSDLAVVYHLLSIKHNHRLRLRVQVHDDPPQIASVTEIWNSANWYERECFDLFGILFDGHPDLRRILTDYGFIGHPMRKDFPLEGHVEVRYDPDKKRVIYQPVSIENRVLVPRVVRDDNRYGTTVTEKD